MGPVIPVRVVDVYDAAKDVRAFLLSASDGSPLPAWTPGAHIEVTLPSGLVRCYSLCGAEHGTARPQTYRIAVGRGAGPGAAAEELRTTIAVGSELRISVPRNHFALPAASAYRFIAGGIGITPIVSMVEHVQCAGKPWQLHYAGRSRDRMAFVERLGSAQNVRLYHDGERMDLDRIIGESSRDETICVCGPGRMIEAAEVSAQRHGRDLLVERFGPRRPTGAGTPVDGAFVVHLKKQGRSVVVEDGVSILEAIEKHVPDVSFSCRSGVCGACVTKVLEGEPDHRDSVLSERIKAANTRMMICVSRSKTVEIVLDL